MNTTQMIKIGHYMMAIGATIFTGGLGLAGAGRYIEYRDAKAIANQKKLDISVKSAEEQALLEAERLQAEIEYEKVETEKLAKMDKNAFAKYKADATAKASEEAIFKANNIMAEAEHKVALAEQKCMKKIAEAVSAQTDAERKYAELLKEYKNRDEVLAAKKKLDDLAKAKNEMKTALETLI